MKVRSWVQVGLILLSLGMGGACATKSEATGISSATSSSPGAGVAYGPQDSEAGLVIENPRDVRGVQPCRLLLDGDLAELGVERAFGRPEDYPYGVGCAWMPQSRSFRLDLGFTEHRGLDEIYQLRSVYEVFEPTIVSGYPAVRVTRADDVTCEIMVGVAEGQLLGSQADMITPTSPPTCLLAEKLAELALARLPTEAA